MPLNIGEAAATTGVSAKMIRHYESVGLLPPPKRTDSGYRTYTDADVHALRFVRQARNHGFSIKHIAELLGLWHNRRRSSKTVKELTSRHIAELDRKIGELEQMKRALQTLADPAPAMTARIAPFSMVWQGANRAPPLTTGLPLDPTTVGRLRVTSVGHTPGNKPEGGGAGDGHSKAMVEPLARSGDVARHGPGAPGRDALCAAAMAFA